MITLTRDEEHGRAGLMPYFRHYGINLCNVRGCRALASCAINIDDHTDAGVCEDHYQEARLRGEWAFTFDIPEA